MFNRVCVLFAMILVYLLKVKVRRLDREELERLGGLLLVLTDASKVLAARSRDKGHPVDVRGTCRCGKEQNEMEIRQAEHLLLFCC